MSGWFSSSTSSSSSRSSRSSRAQSGGRASSNRTNSWQGQGGSVRGSGRRPSRKYNEYGANAGYGGFGGGSNGGRYLQSQNYAQSTTQLEQQVIFVDQAKTCLVVAENHLDSVANGADSTMLSATASGMVACLNLMRMSALERLDDKDGLNAAKAMVKKFREKCETKYAGIQDDRQEKINEVRDAVCSHMMAVLNGDRNVPVLEVSSSTHASEADERGSVTRSMQHILVGEHEVENLRNQVRDDTGRYRGQLQEEAKAGASWEQDGHGGGAFDERSARRVLQGDMVNIAPLKSGRAMDREAQESLKRLVAQDEHMIRQSGSSVAVDDHGCPDLMGHSHISDENEDAEMEDISPPKVSSEKSGSGFGHGHAYGGHGGHGYKHGGRRW